MEDLGKKVGYLKGLMEGMDFSENPATGKLFAAMADLLGDVSDRLLAAEELLDDLNDYVESIDDDLAELEGHCDDDDFHMMDDDEYGEADLDEGDDQIHLLKGNAGMDLDDEEETLAGGICPECGKMFFVHIEDDADAVYACPHCGKRVNAIPLTPENAPIARPEED